MLRIRTDTLKSILQLFHWITQIAQAFNKGLSGDALKIHIQQAKRLADSLSSQNPMLKGIMEPLTNVLSKMVSNPTNGALIKSALDTVDSMATNLLTSSLSGTTFIRFSQISDLFV